VRKSVEIGRLAGVPIRIDRKGLAILLAVNCALVTLLCYLARPDLPLSRAVPVAVVASVLLVVSAALHELAHLIVARRHGQAVGGMILSHFGACVLVDQGHDDERDLGAIVRYVAAGPALTLGLWLGMAAMAELTRPFSASLTMALSVASALNLALLVLNLMPIEPLDGGRLIRCATLAWRRRSVAAPAVEAA
jgi:Zn-dependent protease